MLNLIITVSADVEAPDDVKSIGRRYDDFTKCYMFADDWATKGMRPSTSMIST